MIYHPQLNAEWSISPGSYTRICINNFVSYICFVYILVYIYKIMRLPMYAYNDISDFFFTFVLKYLIFF